MNPALQSLIRDLSQSRDVKAVELNPTMAPATATKLAKDVSDHAVKGSRTKSVVVVSFTK
jgi:hypothetical protein